MQVIFPTPARRFLWHEIRALLKSSLGKKQKGSEILISGSELFGVTGPFEKPIKALDPFPGNVQDTKTLRTLFARPGCSQGPRAPGLEKSRCWKGG